MDKAFAIQHPLATNVESARNSSEQPGLLLLHGYLGSPANWDAVTGALSNYSHILAPDLPFYETPPGANHIDYVTRYLERLVDAQGGRRLVAFGSSFGGQLALHLAFTRPDRFAGLVLTGSSGLYRRNLKGNLLLRPNRAWARDLVAEIFYDESNVTEAMVDTTLDLFADRQKFRVSLRVARFIQETSVRELLPAIRCPVLLVWGANDQITTPEAAREFHSLLPDAELHFLPRCGHVPMMERPAEFTRLVEAFLQRVSATAKVP